MTFKPAVWYPISTVLSVANLIAIGFAAGSAEPLHAVGHGVLTLAFGLWAQRLRRPPASPVIENTARVEQLETEISDLQRELSRTHEGLQFAERLLEHRPDAQRSLLERTAVPHADINATHKRDE